MLSLRKKKLLRKVQSTSIQLGILHFNTTSIHLDLLSTSSHHTCSPDTFLLFTFFQPVPVGKGHPFVCTFLPWTADRVEEPLLILPLLDIQPLHDPADMGLRSLPMRASLVRAKELGLPPLQPPNHPCLGVPKGDHYNVPGRGLLHFGVRGASPAAPSKAATVALGHLVVLTLQITAIH